MGPLGIALATSFAGISGFLVLSIHLVLTKRLRITRLNTLEIIKCMSASVIMGSFIILVNQMLPYSMINVMAKIIIASGILFLSLIVLRQKDFMVIYKKVLKR